MQLSRDPRIIERSRGVATRSRFAQAAAKDPLRSIASCEESGLCSLPRASQNEFFRRFGFLVEFCTVLAIAINFNQMLFKKKAYNDYTLLCSL
jgi:hypothetical protein